MSWKANIESAVAGRRELTFAEVLDEFSLPPDSDEEAVRHALAVFEKEYSVPVGKLRPDDDVSPFTTPP